MSDGVARCGSVGFGLSDWLCLACIVSKIWLGWEWTVRWFGMEWIGSAWTVG